jgi:hypothetical protein
MIMPPTTPTTTALRRCRGDWRRRRSSHDQSRDHLPPPPRALAGTVSAAGALDAFLRLDNNGNGVTSLGAQPLFAAVAGWSTSAAAASAVALVALVTQFDAEQVFAAVRQRIAPENTLRSLFTHGGVASMWRQAKDVFLAKQLVLDDRVDRQALHRLKRRGRAWPRQTWAAAFGLSLPKPSRWAAEPPAARLALRLLERVQGAGGSLDGLTLAELLALAQHGALDATCSSTKLYQRNAESAAHADDDSKPHLLCQWTTDAECGWQTPFAYFAHSCVHYGAVYTRESIDALAQYLEARCIAIGCAEVVEIGAGGGLLAHLLRDSGRLTRRIVATDISPRNFQHVSLGDVEETESFAVSTLSSDAALAQLRPSLVLCAFMGIGQDWTPAWREAGVAEYVLIGALGEGEHSYRCLNEPAPSGYAKLLLEDVSRELIDPADPGRAAGADEPAGRRGSSTLCAVAFRRVPDGV